MDMNVFYVDPNRLPPVQSDFDDNGNFASAETAGSAATGSGDGGAAAVSEGGATKPSTHSAAHDRMLPAGPASEGRTQGSSDGVTGAGFSPHRDRQPADIRGSFRNPRRGMGPRYTTVWLACGGDRRGGDCDGDRKRPYADPIHMRTSECGICTLGLLQALTEATVDNSCLYMVPRRYDPGYLDGDGHRPDGSAASPLDKFYGTRGGGGMAIRCIRAVPTQAGGLVCFTHRIIHWGSEGLG